MNDQPVSGKDLRLLRVGADVRAIDLAAAMGIQPSGITRIEGLRIVTERARARYVAALATFPTFEPDANATEGVAS